MQYNTLHLVAALQLSSLKILNAANALIAVQFRAYQAVGDPGKTATLWL
jgi:hypothetical protein